MSAYPDLAVVFYTHLRGDAREGYAAITIESTLRGLAYPGAVHVHIADDHSELDRLQRVIGIAEELAQPYGWPVTSTRAGGRGYGGSHNAATQVVHQVAEIVMAIEDDWECLRGIPMTRIAGYFEHPEINSVRLGYIGWTQQLEARFFKAHGDTVLLFDPDCLEPHVNSGHPRVERVSYQREIGPWAEGVDAGSVEFDWCCRKAAREGVVWPVDLIPPSHNGGTSYFAHIGTVQARDDQ